MTARTYSRAGQRGRLEEVGGEGGVGVGRADQQPDLAEYVAGELV
jgi:hypothetical protein